jgi:hypothetical protein
MTGKLVEQLHKEARGGSAAVTCSAGALCPCPGTAGCGLMARIRHLAGWLPVAGSLGRPDLRRDAVEPNQRGGHYRQPRLSEDGCLF